MTVAEIERIGAPEISRPAARKAYLEYKRAVLSAASPEERKEYEGLWRGYKAIAAGQQVIDLHQTMRVAGVQEDTLFPRLAICRATAMHCRCVLAEDGSAVFFDDKYRWRRAASQRVTLPTGTLPQFVTQWNAGTFTRYRTGGALERQRWQSDAIALVPIVPPRLHPRAALSNYHILWDAVWTPAPPADPLLLKHLAGALYAIVAQWDLTPLEQAVLAGRLS
jgi:hypothetical protein